MSANDRQVGGDHYKKGGEEHWDRAYRLGDDNFQYIITKWIERWRDKGGIEDLYKARHAIDKYIEVAEKEQAKKQAIKAGALAPKRCRGCNEPMPEGHEAYCDNCWGAEPGPGYVNQD